MIFNPTLATIAALTPHVIAAIALVAMMAQLGLELEPVTDRAAKRRERRLVVRALVLNFGAVPLCALVVARALGATGPVAIALLVLAASPGGRFAPALARAGRGDVGLAVEITLWTNKLNSILSPLLVAWMVGTHRIGLREATFIGELLLLQVAPYFGARALRKRRPSLAVRLTRPARLTASGAALVLFGYLVAHRALASTLLLGVRGWLAVLLFGAVLLLLGWLAGGRSLPVRRAFAITAEARNLALALVITSLAVRDEAVMVAIFGAWILLFAFGGAVTLLARARMRATSSGAAPRSPLPTGTSS